MGTSGSAGVVVSVAYAAISGIPGSRENIVVIVLAGGTVNLSFRRV